MIMKTYYVYHIPNFVRNDGSLGKIGCTSMSIEERAAQQGYTEVELLETHTDIYIASDREIELQKEYGYPVDNVSYWQSVENRHKWDNNTRHNFTKEECSRAGSLGGNKNKETGHMSNVGKIHGKINGTIAGARIHICQYCGQRGKGNAMVTHINKCKQKKEAI
jgi:hypothetical protein